MSTSPDLRQDLRMSFLDYIMGRSSEPDRARFEELLLTNHDFSDAAAACEQQLIDDYALHRLTPEETRSIRLWIEASSARVERVAIARALLQTTAQRRLAPRRINLALAVTACLLTAATLYLVRNKVFHQPQRTTQLATNSATQTPAAPPATQIEAAKPDVILIAAERIRGQQTSTTYQVHRESPIHLQILLPGESAHSGYQVRISTHANQGTALLQQDNLEAQTISGQSGQLYLTVTLAPGSLPPATYTATVTRNGDTLASVFTLQWAHQ